ncbi:MAG: HD domain-containing protein [Eubacterium sp.]|nr:HD domain-containing protein [Eubacterium sp.]
MGKIKIPDAILNKPARLTDEEYDIIKTHVVLGKEMLDNASENLGTSAYLHMAKDIAYYHHEWWDGNKRGYPGAASGTDIPLSARIMAVADVFDALVSKRPYKDGYDMDKAVDIMKEEAGTHFDPAIIDALLDSREKLVTIIEKYSE